MFIAPEGHGEAMPAITAVLDSPADRHRCEAGLPSSKVSSGNTGESPHGATVRRVSGRVIVMALRKWFGG